MRKSYLGILIIIAIIGIALISQVQPLVAGFLGTYLLFFLIFQFYVNKPTSLPIQSMDIKKIM